MIPRLAFDGLDVRGTVLPIGTRVHVMGVVNVTPDSFSDGGRHRDPDAAIAHAMALVAQGADVLDLGAESSRPGAEPVSAEEECRRLLPVVRALARRLTVPLSIDTTKAAVAEQALDAGASLINDISALRFDPRMATVVARSGAGLVLMHMQGTPQTMQRQPQYTDVVADILAFFQERLGAALRAGILQHRILLDPGFGFGKNLEHNLTLLARLDELASLGYPILVGVSRKAFIGHVVGRPLPDRLMGTAGAVAVAVMKGARFVRVHDVAPLRDVVRMIEAIEGRALEAGQTPPH